MKNENFKTLEGAFAHHELDLNNLPEGAKAIKTFEDACAKLGVDPTALPEVAYLPQEFQTPVINHYKAMVITKALNDGWTPDYTDSDQWKYEPRFWMVKDEAAPGGVGFVGSGCVGWDTHTHCGSRLCFASAELCIYASIQFEDIYSGMLL
ncbi:MAG: hypothetical protein F9K23_00880 [Bacteroidetes bacterium]|nr:MAG: hypothetical protein F9K23_00880 [Bacteroidota bacterium]